MLRPFDGLPHLYVMALTSNSNDVDPDVIAAAQTGDPRAHGALYGHYSARIFTLIYRLIPRRAQAEDILQEVFVEVLRSVGSYSGSGSFGGWLRSIAVNKCLSQLRSPWQRSMSWLDISLTDLEDDTDSVSPPLDIVLAMQSELDVAMRRLSATARAVVWLHDVEGYTHSEIARLLNRTPSFSKSQLARAHEQLRTMLTAHRIVTSAASSSNEMLSCKPVTQSLPTNS
jgi:RNA polymerase sigma-70 factor (ECF subfamily)